MLIFSKVTTLKASRVLETCARNTFPMHEYMAGWRSAKAQHARLSKLNYGGKWMHPHLRSVVLFSYNPRYPPVSTVQEPYMRCHLRSVPHVAVRYPRVNWERLMSVRTQHFKSQGRQHGQNLLLPFRCMAMSGHAFHPRRKMSRSLKMCACSFSFSSSEYRKACLPLQ